MTKSELVPASDLMRSLGVLEKKIQWVKCPMCDDEVSKLRPCPFWGPAETVSHVCVECAETVKGLTYLAATYPIPGVDVERSLIPAFENLPSRYFGERSYRARVYYQNWGFTVWPDGTHISVLEDRKTPDQKKQYDNTHQVWFALKKAFENGPVEEEATRTKSGWKI